jgi:1,4-dihydroxy-2-naphthoate octaprenyltransferase
VALQAGVFSAGPALAAGVGALWIQVGCNLANDFFDFARGADTAERLGPARATQQGWLTPKQVAWGAGAALFLAMLVGTYLVAVGGWPILWVGIASLVSAVAYTGGPFPLGYHGLGDLFVLVFFGFVAVCGTVWVQGLVVPTTALYAALPVGTLATAILVVNNLRDRHTDAVAGKRTLAVRMGPRATRLQYVLLVVAAYGVLPLGWGLGDLSPGWMLPFLCLPLAWREIRGVLMHDGAALNAHLAGTARLELVFGLLLALGMNL